MAKTKIEKSPSVRSALLCQAGIPLLVLMLVVDLGCQSRPEAVEAPEWDPDKAATEAMKLYDADGDGSIAGQELDKCPSMKKALNELDKDQDGKLSQEEIEARVQQYVDNGVGRMNFACRIVRGGRPVPGAEVVFEPEPFLADVIQAARGTTNEMGDVIIAVEGLSPPGITVGFYRVRVSKKDGSGKELLPAKFNSETVLGQELALGSPVLSMGQVIFDLR